MEIEEPPDSPKDENKNEFVSARARRRRALRRSYFPSEEGERAALFTHLAKQAFPTYELFIFSLVAGAIMGLGYFIDSQSLLFFGVLVSPILASWIGISLAIVAGAGRLFAQTSVAIFVSSLFVFINGGLAGFATRILPQARTFNEAFFHSRLWVVDFIILALGAVLITLSFVRSEQRPYLPSALITYEFFLPLSAAGFGLGSGIEGLWPQGLLVFFIHLAWATLFCILTLFFLRFYPKSIAGIGFTGFSILTLLIWLLSSTGALTWIKNQAGLATLESDTTPQATATLALAPTQTLTLSPESSIAIIGNTTPLSTRTPSATPTRPTLSPSQTPTSTITAEPTPIIGLISASEGGGAFIRENPGGKVLATLGNGSTVTIIPNDLQEVGNVIWVHIFTTVNDKRVEGWMIQSVLVTATPVADWLPSVTPSETEPPQEE